MSLEENGCYYSSYKGTVHRNDDPEGRNRLMVKVPEVYGDDFHEYWALPKGSYGSFVPEVGEPIWVSFEKGDPRFPIWEHGFWKEKSPSSNPKKKVIETAGGLKVILDDNDGSVTFESKDAKLKMTSGGVEITSKIKVGNGSKNATLAQPLISLIGDMLTQMSLITVNVGGVPSSTPINAPVIQALNSQLQGLISSNTMID